MSAKRLDAYRAENGSAPSSTFTRRRPALRAGRVSTLQPDRITVDAVLERDQFCCARCGTGLHGERGVDYSVHHRKLRSQGGTNCPSNLISLCGHGSAGCHGLVHGGPTAAREAGWLVSATDDPLLMPIAHALYGHVYLTETAGVRTRRPSSRSA
jgi:hypothetical protein